MYQVCARHTIKDKNPRSASRLSSRLLDVPDGRSFHLLCRQHLRNSFSSASTARDDVGDEAVALTVGQESARRSASDTRATSSSAIVGNSGSEISVS
jgi:hypothetical protein